MKKIKYFMEPKQFLKGIFPDWLIEDMFRKRKLTKREKELAKLFTKRIKEIYTNESSEEEN